MQAKVESAKLSLLENPAMQDWINGLWERARSGMLNLARDPERLLAGKFGDALRQLGQTLQDDPRLRQTINRFVRRAAVGAAADYGDAIVRLVSETVRGWDARDDHAAAGECGRAATCNISGSTGPWWAGMVGLAIHAVDVSI